MGRLTSLPMRRETEVMARSLYAGRKGLAVPRPDTMIGETESVDAIPELWRKVLEAEAVICLRAVLRSRVWLKVVRRGARQRWEIRSR